MAVQQLSFLGINRAVTDYSNTSACEELINLRPTTNGHVPVKPFSVKMAELPSSYKKIITHNTTNGVNYLCYKVTAEDDHYRCEVWQVDENGQPVGSTYLTYFYCETEEDYKDISFASVGNILFFSSIGSYPQNTELFWDGESYIHKEGTVPEIDVTIDDSAPIQTAFSSIVADYTGNLTRQERIALALSALNEVQESLESKNCFGPFIMAIAFKTTDGKIFWTSKWRIVNPFEDILTNNEQSLYTKADWQTYRMPIKRDNTWLKDDGSGQNIFPGNDYVFEVGNVGGQYRFIAKTSISAIVSLVQPEIRNSIIKSVEVYTSRPHPYINPSLLPAEARDAYQFRNLDDDQHQRFIFFPINTYQEMEIENELLYLQKSIPLEDLMRGDVRVTFEFGGNIQTTNKTLQTDAGALMRYGKLLAYNSRFHFYDSVAKVEIGMPSFLFPDPSAATRPTQVFAVYNDGQKDTVLYLGTTNLPAGAAQVVISPSIRVMSIVTQYVAGGLYDQETLVYPMTESSRYNFSFCISEPSPQRVIMYDNPDQYRNYLYLDEPSAINVTEQYNPFVFDVNHSYFAPGKVLDVQPQMVAVKDVSFGDYPLNVFTDRGVYALLQGSGTVLYGGFKSISNLIASGVGRIPTESGTFFIAAGGLWTVAGDSAILVSEALTPGPHKFIRSNIGYQSISNGVYDVSGLESDPTFENYVEGASLSYNRHRDELIVSNPDYGYSYVLSLKYRQWFKIGGAIHQDNAGSTIAWVGRNIVDFSDETEYTEEDQPTSVLVHLQSRPFSFNGYMYSHIHRIVSMVRAALSSSEVLVAAIYGSDDLQNWTLLSYAGRSSKDDNKRLEISQLRTPPAARSWRYYTICVGGRVPYDTDFGPVMVDYEPVIRRLG